jgi:hypothetical protein
MPTALEEPATEVSVTPTRKKDGDASTPGHWIRSCPICGAVLMKSETTMTLLCQCGWCWQG